MYKVDVIRDEILVPWPVETKLANHEVYVTTVNEVRHCFYILEERLHMYVNCIL
jgi:hypothetical protein